MRTDIDVPRLKKGGFITRVEHHATLTSTNDHARMLAADAARDETVLVVADEQTAGRGRGVNRWWTGAGSLACSLLFDPALRDIQRQHFHLISLAAAIAIVETARPLVLDRQVGLHWPNDVFAAGRKLSGVLVEALPDGRHIVGIGVNLNNSLAAAPPELSDVVTTLFDMTGREHDRTEILISLLGWMRRELANLATDSAGVARRANQLCLQHGRSITIESGQRTVSGSCLGIAEDGALSARDRGRPREVLFGRIEEASVIGSHHDARRKSFTVCRQGRRESHRAS